MAIARFPSIVIDCPDPGALATFYGAMLDWKVEVSSDWADVRADYGQCISFQQVEGYVPPRWPGQEVPQQMHLDVVVDDLDAAEAAVVDLGATKHEHQPGTSFRVFLDPAGHPFCLCLDCPGRTAPGRSGRAVRERAARWRRRAGAEGDTSHISTTSSAPPVSYWPRLGRRDRKPDSGHTGTI